MTVTRSLPNNLSKNTYKRKKVHIKRKNSNYNVTKLVYAFSNFDNYCSFIDFFNKSNFNMDILADFIALYEYKSVYYLVLNGINLCYPNLRKLLSSITEFANFVNNSDMFICKLLECGNLVMKHNAIKTCTRYFVN